MTSNYKSNYKSFGLQCASGWKSLYEPLIDEVTRLDGEVLQVKEKFAGLRFYYSVPATISKEVHEQLTKKVAAAEDKSFEICEECGEPGQRAGKGWIRTLCEKHAKEWDR